MIKPEFLKRGDKVVIVCTARKFSIEEAQPAISLLESWGLVPVLGNTIGLDNYQLGGSDEERVKDFNNQLADPTIKAIWCARGGYGTVRIIDKIDFSLLLKYPKWLIGFSDVTVLHNHIHNLKVETIHGIMAFSVPNATEESKISLRKALFGEQLEYEIEGSEDNRNGYGRGELIGGNLSIIYSLLGSKSAITTDNKILFIEDLDEYLYHIDRMMYNLKRNNLLTNLSGLIIGGMTDMHDNSIPFGYDAISIIREITKEYNYPIVFNFPAGHGNENRALIFGGTVELSVADSLVALKF